MNSNNANKVTVSQRRLRELVNKVLPVMERHMSHVGTKAAATRLVPAAQAFAKAYDEAIKYQSNQGSEIEQRRESFVELETLLRSSLAIVRAMVPDMDTSELTSKAEMPGELIVSAGRVIELLGQAGENVRDGGALLEALKAATEKAKQAWAEAQASRVELQQIKAAVRVQAVAFNRELVAVRRVLRAVVGTHHFDYQTLRVSRTTAEEGSDSDDTVVEDDDGASTTPTSPSNGASNGATALPLSAGAHA